MADLRLPARGLERQAVLGELRNDLPPSAGAFTDGDHDDLVPVLVEMLRHLAPLTSGPSLEWLTDRAQEVVAMVSSQLCSTETVGSLVEGPAGTAELVTLVAREQARHRGVEQPTMIVTDTAHPGFSVAAHRLGLEVIVVPTGSSHRGEVEMFEAVLDRSTAVVVVSVPNRTFAVVDPVVPVAKRAMELGALCHVDAGLGGWTLPFLSEEEDPTPFDLRVPGVSSVSVDLERLSPAVPSLSVVVYSEPEVFGRHRYLHDSGPGPAAVFPSGLAGTAPYGVLAAWLSLRLTGRSGFVERAQSASEWTRQLRLGCVDLGGVSIVGDPGVPVVAIESEDLDMTHVCGQLRSLGHNAAARDRVITLEETPGASLNTDLVEDLRAAVADAPSRSGLNWE